ncbi:hypothetical protein [uncultured Selenomonas sp.]|uniref:hypothetical protein n=1 Tax=uncultured Selenomonas sp. TaxID=159275 RepID=UPI0025FF1F62|nr:hypothetical protein [uncultured Selenomonas sp.]
MDSIKRYLLEIIQTVSILYEKTSYFKHQEIASLKNTFICCDRAVYGRLSLWESWRAQRD